MHCPIKNNSVYIVEYLLKVQKNTAYILVQFINFHLEMNFFDHAYKIIRIFADVSRWETHVSFLLSKICTLQQNMHKGTNDFPNTQNKFFVFCFSNQGPNQLTQHFLFLSFFVFSEKVDIINAL